MINIKSHKTFTILGVNTNSTQNDQVLSYICSSLKNSQKVLITTPNPEIVLKCQSDPELAKIINKSDIRLTDGTGLSAANYFLSMKRSNSPIFSVPLYFLQGIWTGLLLITNNERLFAKLPVIKGREFFLELVKLADKKKLRIFLLGGTGDTSTRTSEWFKKNYKKVTVDHAEGPYLDGNGVPVDENEERMQKDVINKINSYKPDILFVAFGAPKQEKWVDKWLGQLDVGVVMVVGGAFDYYSGDIKLAKKIARSNYEWIWRLLSQPRRFRRIINATIVFPWKVYLHKLRSVTSTK